jgi:solute carrier family 35 protein E3
MFLMVQQEIRSTTAGLLWAIAGITTTSAAQIYFGPLKKDLGLDALQLLFHTSPWLAFGSFATIPWSEDVEVLLNFPLTWRLQLLLAASCIVAVGFNVSNYTLLSMVTPLTYNLLGHVKTVAIIVFGAYFFHSWPTTIMTVGMVLTIFGVLLYREETERQVRSVQQQQQVSRPPASIEEPIEDNV